LTDLEGQVKNEGFRLLRLCKDLREFILSGQARKTYLDETDYFLKHIKKSLKAIDKFVRETINIEIAFPLRKAKLKEFDLIREGLSWLYVFVKEAIDADTLSIPYSLTIFLNHTATKLQDPSKVSLVVLGSSDLMYYKYNLEYLRKLTNNLASIIEKYPVLPQDIGILKFPYCAAQEVLVNCILFHEMGHYIYEKTKLQEYFYNSINDNLRSFIKNEKIMEIIAAPLLVQRRLFNYVINLILRWADEIFADIFAIRALGPAFHLACLEMEQILPTKIERNRNFSANHPANDFRFKMHAKWLSDGGWDVAINEHTPEIFSQLQNHKKLKMEDFVITPKSPLRENKMLEEKLHKWMLQEFEKMVIKVEEELSTKLKDFENPFSDFDKYNSLVRVRLEHGIVPSTVYDNKQKHHPNPTTILNSGFFFYLGGMDALLEKVENNDSDVDKRMNYEKRLNQWLAKAIEDWQILLEEDKL